MMKMMMVVIMPTYQLEVVINNNEAWWPHNSTDGHRLSAHIINNDSNLGGSRSLIYYIGKRVTLWVV